MVIAISGSSGLVGSALRAALEARGHTIKRLVRRPARGPEEISWDPEREQLDARGLEGVDAVVNLAGESLAQRWTTNARTRIRSSRVNGTIALSRAIASLAVVGEAVEGVAGLLAAVVVAEARLVVAVAVVVAVAAAEVKHPARKRA